MSAMPPFREFEKPLSDDAGRSCTQIYYFMGFFPGIKAFCAAVLGGIGNIPGAMRVRADNSAYPVEAGDDVRVAACWSP